MGKRGVGATKQKAAAAALGSKPRKPRWAWKGLSRAERVVRFLESLPVTAGPFAGSKFKVRPWQRDIIEAMYATDETGARIVREVLFTIPRGNGKTGLAAGLALCHLCGPEAEPRGQVYSAASDRNQAGIIFDECEAMILQTPWFAARLNIQRFHKRIEDEESGSVYRALSADARKAHGLNVSFFVYDEIAQAPNRDLYDNLKTGMGKRVEPLAMVISTQSPDPLHVMSELVDYGTQVRDGVIEDPAFLPALWIAPDDAEPWDEEVWRACNPALGDFRSLREMRETAERAKKLPSLEAVFRQLYLNQRIDAETRFISSAEWNACAATPDIETVKRRPCFGGLDLGSTRDLTALVLVFPDGDGSVDVLPFFWCPKDTLTLREEADKVPYRQWAREGLIEPTPGKATDHAYVVHRLGELSTMFDIQTVAYDRWRIEDLRKMLAEEGVNVTLEPFGQGFKDMGPAVDDLERLTAEGQLRHGGHPILTWNAANAIIARDPAGNRKLDKERSREKIDGLVALAQALGASKRHVPEGLPACLASLVY